MSLPPILFYTICFYGILYIITSGGMIHYLFLLQRCIFTTPIGNMMCIIALKILVGGCRMSNIKYFVSSMFFSNNNKVDIYISIINFMC